PVMRSPDVDTYLQGIGIGPDPLSQLVHFGVAFRPSGAGIYKPFKELYEMADRPDLRNQWKDEVFEVRGQYDPQGGQYFYLVRYRINCCYSDATPVRMPVLSRENLPGFTKGEWVKVTGRVEFRDT